MTGFVNVTPAQNLAAAALQLPAGIKARLDAIAAD